MEEQAHNSIHQVNNIGEQLISQENKMEIINPKEESIKKQSSSEYVFDKNYFFDRSFHEADDGHYDEEGFYYTPEGSFWNDEKDYFNRYGYDKYGGKYNIEGVYIPGEGWDSDLQCYIEDIDNEILEKKADEFEGIIEERIQMMNNLCDVSVLSENIEEDLFNEEKEKKTDFLNIKKIIKEEIEEFSQKSGLNVNVEQVVKEIAPLYHEYNENLENKQIESEKEENKNKSEKKISNDSVDKTTENCKVQEKTEESQISNLIFQSQKDIENNKIISVSKIINNNIIITSEAKRNSSKKLGEDKNHNSNDQNENNSNIMVIEKPITPSKSKINSKTPIKSAIKSVSKANNI